MPSRARAAKVQADFPLPPGYSRCRKTVQLLISVVDFHSRSLLSPGVRQMNDPFNRPGHKRTPSSFHYLSSLELENLDSLDILYREWGGKLRYTDRLIRQVSMGVFLCIELFRAWFLKDFLFCFLQVVDSLLFRWSWIFVQFVNYFELILQCRGSM